MSKEDTLLAATKAAVAQTKKKGKKDKGKKKARKEKQAVEEAEEQKTEDTEGQGWCYSFWMEHAIDVEQKEKKKEKKSRKEKKQKKVKAEAKDDDHMEVDGGTPRATTFARLTLTYAEIPPLQSPHHERMILVLHSKTLRRTRSGNERRLKLRAETPIQARGRRRKGEGRNGTLLVPHHLLPPPRPQSLHQRVLRKSRRPLPLPLRRMQRSFSESTISRSPSQNLIPHPYRPLFPSHS